MSQVDLRRRLCVSMIVAWCGCLTACASSQPKTAPAQQTAAAPPSAPPQPDPAIVAVASSVGPVGVIAVDAYHKQPARLVSDRSTLLGKGIHEYLAFHGFQAPASCRAPDDVPQDVITSDAGRGQALAALAQSCPEVQRVVYVKVSCQDAGRIMIEGLHSFACEGTTRILDPAGNVVASNFASASVPCTTPTLAPASCGGALQRRVVDELLKGAFLSMAETPSESPIPAAASIP